MCILSDYLHFCVSAVVEKIVKLMTAKNNQQGAYPNPARRKAEKKVEMPVCQRKHHKQKAAQPHTSSKKLPGADMPQQIETSAACQQKRKSNRNHRTAWL